MSRRITDDKYIEETSTSLAGQVRNLVNQFRVFKIEKGLTSASKIETLDDALCDIGSEIGYLSHQYWSFTSKLRAADSSLDVFNFINNWLGWLTVEFEVKQRELREAYPILSGENE